MLTVTGVDWKGFPSTVKIVAKIKYINRDNPNVENELIFLKLEESKRDIKPHFENA